MLPTAEAQGTTRPMPHQGWISWGLGGGGRNNDDKMAVTKFGLPSFGKF